MKPVTRLSLLLSTALLAAVLIGCASESHANLPPVSTIRPNTAKVPATLRIVIPTVKNSNAKRRHALNIAFNTAGLAINVYKSPKTTYPTPIATLAADISSTSSLCSTQADGGRICTIPITAPTGTNDFAITTFDTKPVSGSIPNGAPQLGYGASSAQVISVGSANTVSFSIAGVLASATALASATNLAALTSATVVLDVAGLDADHNVIVTDTNGDGYVNPSGNPATIILSVSGGGSTPSLSSTSLSAPSVTGTTLTYNANNITNAQAIGGFNVAISANTSTGGSTSTTTIAVAPGLAEYPTNSGTTYYPNGIELGPDGNIWFEEATANTSQIGKMTNTGAVTLYPVPAPWVESGVIGADNNLWLDISSNSGTHTTGAHIAKITTSGAVSIYATSDGGGPYSMVKGPDNQIWYTEPYYDYVGAFNTSLNTGADYPLPSGSCTALSGYFCIITANSSYSWISEPGTNKIAAIFPAGADVGIVAGQYSIPTSNSGVSSIASGPDGRIWITEYATNKIAAFNPSVNSWAEYTVLTTGAQPTVIISGPGNNMTFVENAGGKIATINTSTNIITEIPNCFSSIPSSFAIGADGRIWFAEYAAQKIGHLL